jgi:hypothetical protein
MNITKDSIWDLPWEWARDLACDLDPDGDLQRDGISYYGIISENWPECRPEVEAMLTDLQTSGTLSHANQ